MSKRICVWGSSIGQGYYDFKNGGWVHLLKMDCWQRRGSELEVMNLSIDGNTSENVIQRFAVEYQVRKPDVTIIAIGMNDSLFAKSIGKNWVEIEDTIKNLQKITNIVKQDKKDVVFIGLTKINEKILSPVPWDENLFYSVENVKKYDEIIRQVAKENGAPYCSMYDLLNNEDLSDGLHPNAEGHKKMFLRIKDFLRENKTID